MLSPQNNCRNRVHFVRVHFIESRPACQTLWSASPWESCQCNQSLTFWAGKSRHLWAVLKGLEVQRSEHQSGAREHKSTLITVNLPTNLRSEKTTRGFERESFESVHRRHVQINGWVTSGPRFTICPAWNAGGCARQLHCNQTISRWGWRLRRTKCCQDKPRRVVNASCNRECIIRLFLLALFVFSSLTPDKFPLMYMSNMLVLQPSYTVFRLKTNPLSERTQN